MMLGQFVIALIVILIAAGNAFQIPINQQIKSKSISCKHGFANNHQFSSFSLQQSHRQVSSLFATSINLNNQKSRLEHQLGVKMQTVWQTLLDGKF